MKPIDTSRLEALQIDTVIAGASLAALRPRFESLAARHENGTAPRAVSSYQLFQTPHELARRLVELAGIESSMTVLEPSAGLGRILRALPAGCQTTAVEMAPQIAAELYRAELPGVKLIQRDFLTCTPAELGSFDRIVMNPPFHMRADIRHILHARRFLKPAGRLVALCLAGSHRSAALRSIAATWIELPADTFAKEGTRVMTCMLMIEN